MTVTGRRLHGRDLNFEPPLNVALSIHDKRVLAKLVGVI